MKDQTLYDQHMYEVIAKKRNFSLNLCIFTDLEKACLAIHAHLYENNDDELRYFVNVYN